MLENYKSRKYVLLNTNVLFDKLLDNYLHKLMKELNFSLDSITYYYQYNEYSEYSEGKNINFEFTYQRILEKQYNTCDSGEHEQNYEEYEEIIIFKASFDICKNKNITNFYSDINFYYVGDTLNYIINSPYGDELYNGKLNFHFGIKVLESYMEYIQNILKI